MILSILIPTIPDRYERFTRLYNELNSQHEYMKTVHPTLGDIEILVDASEKFLSGGPSIGKKREALVTRAKGRYLCFLDDDENIAPNYLEVLVRLCNQGKDVCTFRNISKLKPFWMIVEMKLGHPNEQATFDTMIKRSPWHVCPVRSDFAKRYPFEDTSYGEDWDWFSKVLTHCQTSAHSDAVIHQYNHGDHSEADKIIAQ